MSDERKIPCGTELLPIYGDAAYTSLVACDISKALRSVVERYHETGKVEKVLLVHTEDAEITGAQLYLAQLLPDTRARNDIWSGVRVVKIKLSSGEEGDAERLRDCIQEVADSMSGTFTTRQLMQDARKLMWDRFSR